MTDKAPKRPQHDHYPLPPSTPKRPRLSEYIFGNDPRRHHRSGAATPSPHDQPDLPGPPSARSRNENVGFGEESKTSGKNTWVRPGTDAGAVVGFASEPELQSGSGARAPVPDAWRRTPLHAATTLSSLTNIHNSKNSNAGIQCKTEEDDKLFDLLQKFASATIELAHSSFGKDNNGGAQGLEARITYPSRNEPSPRSTDTSKFKNDSRNNPSRNRKEQHAEIVQNLAIEIRSKDWQSLEAVNRLGNKVNNYELALEVKGKSIKSMAESIQRLHLGFSGIRSEMEALGSKISGLTEDISSHSQGQTRDGTILTRLASVEEKQIELESLVNDSQKSLENMKLSHVKLNIDNPDHEILKSQVRDLAKQIGDIAINNSNHTALGLPPHGSKDLMLYVADLAKEGQKLTGKFELIRDQTREKESFLLERIDSIQSGLDELKRTLYDDTTGLQLKKESLPQMSGPKLVESNVQIQELSDTFAVLERKLSLLQSETTPVLTALKSGGWVESLKSLDVMQMQAKIEFNTEQSDSLSVALRSLESRYNNLTNEETASLMAKEMHRLHPSLAQIEQTLPSLQQTVNDLSKKLQQIEKYTVDKMADVMRDLDALRRLYRDTHAANQANTKALTKVEHDYEYKWLKFRQSMQHQQQFQQSQRTPAALQNARQQSPFNSSPARNGDGLLSQAPQAVSAHDPTQAKSTALAGRDENPKLDQLLKTTTALKVAINLLNKHTGLAEINWNELEKLAPRR